MKWFDSCAVVICVLLGSTGTVNASIQTYGFSGTLEYTSDTAGLLSESFSIGDAFTGFFSFEDNLVDGSPSPEYFTSSSPSIVSSVNVGGYEFIGNRSGSIDLQGSSNTFLLLNGWESDPFVDLGSNPGRLILIVLSGRSSSFNDSLPSELDLADFSSARVQVFGDTGPGGPTFTLTGRINSLAPLNAEVPEPSSLIIWSLLGVGSFCVVRQRIRRVSIP
jgi:hypothetical protein